jgi:hypothetical protein
MLGMNKTRFAYLLILCSLLTLGSCKKENLCDCFKSTGSDIREDRDASAFTEIQLEGKIDLVLTQDTLEKIQVLGGRHLISNIETSISGGRLYIRNHNTCNFVRSYDRQMTVYVSVHHLKTLFYNGAGDVSGTNTLKDSVIGVESMDGSGHVNLNLMTTVAFATIHTGPATITLSGSAILTYLYSGGNGVIHMDQLPCKQIYATQRGTGDFYIRSTADSSSYLDVLLSNSGDVYCAGKPAKLKTDRSGTGQLYVN